MGSMGLVSLSSRAIFANGGLAFPMQKFTADRVVAITRRGREAVTGLVEGDCEQI